MSILTGQLNTGTRFNARIPKKIPWFINIYGTAFTLASRNVPDSISSQKAINRVDQQIPGGGTSISKFGNITAEKINFSVKLASFNNELGVSDQVRFFDMLRTPYSNAYGEQRPFVSNPKVVYWYGNGKLPMLYYVGKCDYTLSKWNIYGQPQVMSVSLELILDEDSDVYKAETIIRQILATSVSAESFTSTFTPTKFKNGYKISGSTASLIRRFL